MVERKGQECIRGVRFRGQNWGRVQQEALPLQTTSRFSPVHVTSLVPRWPEFIGLYIVESTISALYKADNISEIIIFETISH